MDLKSALSDRCESLSACIHLTIGLDLIDELWTFFIWAKSTGKSEGKMR